ncbi:hypothetical protein KFK09_025021 [Dendrobium nobile]|uniref:Uncharacterized protein n=1 Tax=Dendrobium nobile TaxID=94219 RepID=A0A8T3AFH5_DENNO|nr:hypothetical protein KFK09_025019 [Dendrobium nobile]KAI0494875.1 hypothetical protein KFK09_025021 [Dendrobium nobile]
MGARVEEEDQGKEERKGKGEEVGEGEREREILTCREEGRSRRGWATGLVQVTSVEGLSPGNVEFGLGGRTGFREQGEAGVDSSRGSRVAQGKSTGWAALASAIVGRERRARSRRRGSRRPKGLRPVGAGQRQREGEQSELCEIQRERGRERMPCLGRAEPRKGRRAPLPVVLG